MFCVDVFCYLAGLEIRFASTAPAVPPATIATAHKIKENSRVLEKIGFCQMKVRPRNQPAIVPTATSAISVARDFQRVRLEVSLTLFESRGDS
ncbi:hypothetical protein FF011L_03190 [Roseimaritima multifibrata]|uniref:Uncharacterized protein n=1 Tax=Roseimaritima multifibrata TaxID=1930274 RepID=A0A517M9M6_9BACT|nr:hypothetical protein FF011L_03190 [Roseimaritima multifibrata]